MSKSIRVRMYNVGFGDSFLLSLPNKKTMLVDAGFHSQGKGAFGGNELVQQILADVKDITGKHRIDVVIATHRHQDHVYAFNSAEWDTCEIGEVWLPWVEDRNNRQAMRLWKKQVEFAKQLNSALPTFALDDGDRRSVEFMLWNAGIDPPGFDAGGWSNRKALDCLHGGFASRDRTKPRFLPEDETFPYSFETHALLGVKVHVLGPPRDPELIEELDPEADGETYRALALRAAAAKAGGGVGADVTAPFGLQWQVPDAEAGFRLEAAEIERINDLAQSADAVFAAEKVDGMINSTSLVLLLEIGNARLLLPGDAEWGTWKRILADDGCRTLLRSATFFKVGHHGSHNATPKTLVEEVLRRQIPAMISTQQGAGNYRNNIPLQDLIDAMTAHGISHVRSDRVGHELPSGFKAGDKWIDLILPC